MPKNEVQKNNALIDYKPAELRQCKSRWYVSYYAKNPANGLLCRKTVKINRIKSVTERKKFGQKLVAEINGKLYNGWNPFIEETAPKAFVPIKNVIETFLKLKSKEVRVSTLAQYQYAFDVLLLFIQNTNTKKEFYASDFTRNFANELTKNLALVRNVGSAKYNYYIVVFKMFGKFCMQNQYIKTNPFEGIKPRKKAIKNREPIPNEIRKILYDYLLKNNKELLAISLMVYYCLLRPYEILNLKKNDFYLHVGYIKVPGHVAKNGKERISTVPDTIKPFLQQFVDNCQNDMYVFGRLLKPNAKKTTSNYVSTQWRLIRKTLGISAKYPIYSLRDTGIIELIEAGLPLNEVAQHAAHRSLEVTSIYALQSQKAANQTIKKNAVKF